MVEVRIGLIAHSLLLTPPRPLGTSAPPLKADWALTGVFFIDVLLLLLSSTPRDAVRDPWIMFQVGLSRGEEGADNSE